MSRYLLTLLPALALAASPRVEIRGAEVWLVRKAGSIQLTFDGKPKSQPLLSPQSDRIAYYQPCLQSEGCSPAIVILDLEGHRLNSFPPIGEHSSCFSVSELSWAGPDRIAANCHINPSLDEYVETNVIDGRKTRDLLGFDFTRSPDGRSIAHVGWIIHFAPAYAQSYYLQVDDLTIYPLPAGSLPARQIGLSSPPDVVRQHGLTYSGIHEFSHGLFWAPDSRHIALVDCIYDWTANGRSSLSAGDGVESNRRCAAAVVSIAGRALVSPLPSGVLDPRISWTDSHTVSVRSGPFHQELMVP